ncbi:MAG: hypothetical protein J6B96_05270 [Agathobacter sp.]|nr:hypothetical protein [Agathobacter sp.]
MLTVEMKQHHITSGIEHSSKGNQLKWEQDGWWHKADQFGYESLAEVVASHVLMKSTAGNVTIYEPVMIRYKEKEYRGCRSKNFRKEGEELIPLERLIRTYTGMGLAKQLARMPEVKDRIAFTEELVRTITGLENFGKYLAMLMELDAFFLNEDRHTNNISLLYNVEKKEYRLCPFYDMGLALFADTVEEFPIEEDYFACKDKIKAKPFSRDFDEQLDAATLLYGSHLKFHFKKNQIGKTLDEIIESENEIPLHYTKQELKRVEETLRYQASKYPYLFQD